MTKFLPPYPYHFNDHLKVIQANITYKYFSILQFQDHPQTHAT
jgi:hypothetical protein